MTSDAQIDAIIRTTADYYGVDATRIVQRGRYANVVKARQVAIYLAYSTTSYNDREISYAFGRDRSTVTYSRHRVQDLMDTGDSVKDDVEEIGRMV